MKCTILNLLFIFCLFGGYYVEAQVLWYGDPNLSVNSVFRRFDPDGNSNPTGSDCVDDPNTPPFVTNPIDPDFGKFWRITKPTSRKRAEFARTTGTVNSFVPQQGGTYYYGWRWRISSNPNPVSGITIFQWKTDQGSDVNTNKQNYPFNMGYDGTFVTLNAYGPAEPNWNQPGSIEARKTTLWRQTVSEDTWVSFVIKVKVDNTYDNVNNRYNGYIEFWYNGVQQTLMNSDFQNYQVVLGNSNMTAYHKTNDGVEVYPKWGSYNQNACDLEINTDFNEMRVASTYEEALPSGTVPDPETGIEGVYKFKNVKTLNYMTYNSADGNIFGSASISDPSQLFRLVKTGTTASGGEILYNIDSEVTGVGVLKAENLNVTATTTVSPSISNPNSFLVLDLGGGVYNFIANTSSSRIIAEDLITNNVGYTTSNIDRAQWVFEKQTLSVNFNLFNSVKVYPNPVKDYLNIQNINEDITKIRIYDITGKLVKQIENINRLKNLKITTIDFLKGFYFLRLDGESSTITYKIIKY